MMDANILRISVMIYLNCKVIQILNDMRMVKGSHKCPFCVNRQPLNGFLMTGIRAGSMLSFL